MAEMLLRGTAGRKALTGGFQGTVQWLWRTGRGQTSPISRLGVVEGKAAVLVLVEVHLRADVADAGKGFRSITA